VAPSEGDQPLLSVRGLTKRFGPVVANDGIDFDLRPGEIHALLGENGAGKTTLMNVLFGLVAPDAGEMHVRGAPYRPADPSDAIQAGIGMVHQHFMLIPTFSVVENVVLGAEPTHGLALDLDRARQALRELMDRYALQVDPDALIRDLPVGLQQRVEILKALYRGAGLLILDEPTAVLAPPEADQLFRVLRELAAGGLSVILISHKLREVLAVADRVSVLRRGQIVGSVLPGDASEASLASMMVGRPVELTVTKGLASPGEIVLQVADLRVLDDRGVLAVDGLDLTVRSAEIVGIAGVEGNGQTELVEVLAGVRSAERGSVRLGTETVEHLTPRQLTARGVARIPEDRHKHGLVLAHSLADNLVLTRFSRVPFARGLRRMFDAIRRLASRLIAEFDVRAASIDARASTLSGGNQQKAVVARELAQPPRLLIAAQPTRGIDVGATELIHQRLVAARDGGAAILLVSAELDELLSLSDRIVVVYRGRVTADVDPAMTSTDDLGLLMAGAGAAR